MKNKNIIKVILLTSLLVSGVSKSQEFYTCVPKEDSVKNLSQKLEKTDEKIKDITTQIRKNEENMKVLIRREEEIIDLIKSLPTPKQSELDQCLEGFRGCFSECCKESIYRYHYCTERLDCLRKCDIYRKECGLGLF